MSPNPSWLTFELHYLDLVVQTTTSFVLSHVHRRGGKQLSRRRPDKLTTPGRNRIADFTLNFFSTRVYWPGRRSIGKRDEKIPSPLTIFRAYGSTVFRPSWNSTPGKNLKRFHGSGYSFTRAYVSVTILHQSIVGHAWLLVSFIRSNARQFLERPLAGKGIVNQGERLQTSP